MPKENSSPEASKRLEESLKCGCSRTLETNPVQIHDYAKAGPAQQQHTAVSPLVKEVLNNACQKHAHHHTEPQNSIQFSDLEKHLHNFGALQLRIDALMDTIQSQQAHFAHIENENMQLRSMIEELNLKSSHGANYVVQPTVTMAHYQISSPTEEEQEEQEEEEEQIPDASQKGSSHDRTTTVEAAIRAAHLEKLNGHLQKELLETKHELDIARQEAVLSKRQAKKLLERSNNSPDMESSATPSKEMVALQNRIKVLEAQNLKFRLDFQEASSSSLKSGFYDRQGIRRRNSKASERVKGPAESSELSELVMNKWEADKRLHNKVAALQKGLADKNNVISSLKLQNQTLSDELGAAKADAELKAQQISSFKEKLKESHLGEADKAKAREVSKVHDLMNELSTLQEKHDALERRLLGLHPATTRRQNTYEPLRYTEFRGEEGGDGICQVVIKPQDTPSHQDQYSHIVHLEKDQALAEVGRLKERLKALLDILSHDGKGSISREQLIEKVKADIEKSHRILDSSVSSSKYMHVVEKCRKLRARIAEFEEAEKHHASMADELATAKKRIVELSSSNGEWRARASAEKKRNEMQLTARERIMNAQVTELERALEERDAELATLQQGGAADQLKALLQEGIRPRDLINELLRARQTIRKLEAAYIELKGGCT